MIKLIAKIIEIKTNGLHWILKHFIKEKTLLKWKPIHLCWWFIKHDLPIPKYFIGTHEVSSPSPSVSPSRSPSISPSRSPSNSPSQSPSSSVSPSRSPSISPSVSPSISPSQSPSSSVSPSQSPSISPSTSPSISPSNSPSQSPSSSVSPSNSPSESPSISPSNSPSQSPSSSVSPSESPSESPSRSPSISPSNSPSVSPSGSPSESPSISPSQSPSSSVSPSISPSQSPSVSPSESPSESPSVSPSRSPSISPSVSPSPSPGWTNYTRGDYVSLPADDADLEINYSAQDVIDVGTFDGVRVAQTASGQYAIHQYKDYIGASTSTSVLWRGQTDQACTWSPVVLQIYNRVTPGWETLNSDSTTAENTTITLNGVVADTSDYVTASGYISCRIYQLSV